MARKLSPQRRAVLDLAQLEGRIGPKRVGAVLGMNPSAARKLCFAMLSDDQLTSPERGVYELPEAETVTFEAGGAEEVTALGSATPDVTATDEPRTGMPILGESPSGTYVFSLSDGGMIPHEWSRERKGYR
jgi:hypothetical protein